MKGIRNRVVNALMIGALCSSVVFADGEMGGGGLADTGIDSHGSKTVITRSTEDGEMGGGGLFESSYVKSMIGSVYDYLQRMF